MNISLLRPVLHQEQGPFFSLYNGFVKFRLSRAHFQTMNEIEKVLANHGKPNGFGMKLLRKHFHAKSKQAADLHSLFLHSLLRNGYAVLSGAIDPLIAGKLIANYDKNIGYDRRAGRIRADIGRGLRKTVLDTKMYRLPKLLDGLYEITRPAAQIWADRLHFPMVFPRKYSDFQKSCEAVGQNDPVVVFRYERGSYVRYHSDPMNEIPFPFQFLGLLSDHHSFTGGDFLLRRTVRRASSTIRLKLQQGDVLMFPVARFKSRRRGTIESWEHAVAEVKTSVRYSISFLLNQTLNSNNIGGR